MKRRVLSGFGAVLVLALACSAQQGKRDRSNPSLGSKKLVLVSGKVGAGGKTFVAGGHGIVWSVTNPEILAASEGKDVRIRAVLDAATHELRAVVVEVVPNEGARLEDTAFHR